MFTNTIIDLNVSTDTTIAGNGVVTMVDSRPLLMVIAFAVVALFILLQLSFMRLSELRERVLQSTELMTREKARQTARAAAFRLALQAKDLSGKVEDPERADVFRGLHTRLYEVSIRRAAMEFEVEGLMSDIKRCFRQLPESSSVKVVERDFKCDLSEIFDIGNGKVYAAPEIRERVRSLVDTLGQRLAQLAGPMTDQENEVLMTKVRQYVQRCNIRRHEATPLNDREQGWFAEIIQIPANIEQMFDHAHKSRVIAQGDRLDLFSKDLSEWIEIMNTLPYAPWWSIEAYLWFSVEYFGRAILSGVR